MKMELRVKKSFKPGPAHTNHMIRNEIPHQKRRMPIFL